MCFRVRLSGIYVFMVSFWVSDCETGGDTFWWVVNPAKKTVFLNKEEQWTREQSAPLAVKVAL